MYDFVNYSEEVSHGGVCLWCLGVFDKRESKREHFCSLYCEKTYTAATVWALMEDDDAQG